MHEEPQASPSNLETNLGRKLDAPRPASAQEGIADAHVASGSERQEADAAPRRVQPIVRRISNKIRQVRIGKVGMIKQVKELSSDLQVYPLRDCCVLEDGEIELLKTGGAQRVPPQIAEVAGAGKAVAVAAPSKTSRVTESAGHLKG